MITLVYTGCTQAIHWLYFHRVYTGYRVYTSICRLHWLSDTHVSRLNRVYRSVGTTQAIHMHMVNTNTGLHGIHRLYKHEEGRHDRHID